MHYTLLDFVRIMSQFQMLCFLFFINNINFINWNLSVLFDYLIWKITRSLKYWFLRERGKVKEVNSAFDLIALNRGIFNCVCIFSYAVPYSYITCSLLIKLYNITMLRHASKIRYENQNLTWREKCRLVCKG